jgi:L-histidine Nalpha-methyltransferase
LINTILKNYTKKTVFNDRLSVYYLGNVEENSFADDVKTGLTAENKYLLPKYFYDSEGSQLFEKICETEEYYVTRTETSILKEYSSDIAKYNLNKKILVELGSGSSVKTRYIINALMENYRSLHYVPIDVSDIMISSSEQLTSEIKDISISGLIAEYESGIELSSQLFKEPKLMIFLGSSIGNFDLFHAEQFIRFISSKMNYGDSLLVGFDMVKDINVLNAAYNDKEGVTSAFNLNLLKRINNELNGNFNLENFEHIAFFNAQQSRIEMHLVAKQNQEVRIDLLNLDVCFKAGERIHTENSYKFTPEMINEIAAYSDLHYSKFWTDEKGYFRLCLFSKL